MLFDREAGSLVFEFTLRFRAYGEIQYSTPLLIQADEPEEAEEKVLEHLESLDLGIDFQIVEISDPYPAEDYQRQTEEEERQVPPLLEEFDEEEMRDFLDI
ncbi:MAG: hypothetical protein LLF99_07780 [Desulfobacteraceae bacterium]|nr:hypothetical protein [Desulfobacteraceae bacterium]